MCETPSHHPLFSSDRTCGCFIYQYPRCARASGCHDMPRWLPCVVALKSGKVFRTSVPIRERYFQIYSPPLVTTRDTHTKIYGKCCKRSPGFSHPRGDGRRGGGDISMEVTDRGLRPEDAPDSYAGLVIGGRESFTCDSGLGS